MNSPLVKKICSDFDDPSRLCKGIADSPDSLMEGRIGEAILYMDIIEAFYDETFIPKFPAFEV